MNSAKLLILLVAFFGVSLATPFGCASTLVPTARTGAGSSWVVGSTGYQIFGIQITPKSFNSVGFDILEIL